MNNYLDISKDPDAMRVELDQQAPPISPQFQEASQAWGVCTFFDKEVGFDIPDELIRDTLPAQGIGFIAGQSGAGKTYLSIELAFCLSLGTPFADRTIEKTGATIIAAFEGASTFSGRVKAKINKLGDEAKNPAMAVISGGEGLNEEKALRDFEAQLHATAKSLKSKTGQSLRLVIIDTIAATGLIGDGQENDPAVWTKIQHAFGGMAKRLDCVIAFVHHYGKASEAGLRGSSNNRAIADFVIALTCERDELTGENSNHRLALTKNRNGPEGPIAGVEFESIELAKHKDGAPISNLVMKFDANKNISKKSSNKKPSRVAKDFREAFFEVLNTHGKEIKIRGSETSPFVKCVTLERIKEEFERRYVPTCRNDKASKNDALRKAFGRGKDSPFNQDIESGYWSGESYFWCPN